jgi:subtilisin-like proprotein convertase family protein
VEFIMHVESDNFRVEHVLLTTSISHPKRGQLEITLTSPDGTESRLATQRKKDRGAHYEWTFSSVRHWGEMAKGDWKVRIADRVKGKVGVINSLKLTLWGASPDGTLVAGGVQQFGQAVPVASIPASGTTTVDFVIRNGGSKTLTNVTTSLAANSYLMGSANAAFASIAPGETRIVPVTLTVTQSAVGIDARPALTITADDYSDKLQYSLVIGTLGTVTVSGNGPIALPTLFSRSGSGKAGLYPATAEVSAPAGSRVTDVKLHIHHLDHERSYDIDALLVSPDGKRMLPMSDAGGYDVLDADITLTDSAENALPDTAPLFGGVFRPANYGATLDKFPSPAPKKPYQSSFSALRGSPAAGTWQLFIYDDASRAFGSIGAWELEIQYAQP